MEQCELEKQNKINFKNVCLIWRENTWLESTLDNQELILVNNLMQNNYSIIIRYLAYYPTSNLIIGFSQ